MWGFGAAIVRCWCCSLLPKTHRNATKLPRLWWSSAFSTDGMYIISLLTKVLLPAKQKIKDCDFVWFCILLKKCNLKMAFHSGPEPPHSVDDKDYFCSNQSDKVTKQRFHWITPTNTKSAHTRASQLASLFLLFRMAHHILFSSESMNLHILQ